MSYELRESPPTVDRFLELRDAAGMADRSREAVESGLPNSQYVVTVVATGADAQRGDDAADDGGDADAGVDNDCDDTAADDERVVGMARVVGDGGSVFHICDMVVHPAHQRQGLGGRLMDAVMAWIDETAPRNAYVNLMADVDGFYEQWGFERTAPASKGMYYRVGE